MDKSLDIKTISFLTIHVFRKYVTQKVIANH